MLQALDFGDRLFIRETNFNGLKSALWHFSFWRHVTEPRRSCTVWLPMWEAQKPSALPPITADWCLIYATITPTTSHGPGWGCTIPRWTGGSVIGDVENKKGDPPTVIWLWTGICLGCGEKGPVVELFSTVISSLAASEVTLEKTFQSVSTWSDPLDETCEFSQTMCSMFVWQH